MAFGRILRALVCLFLWGNVHPAHAELVSGRARARLTGGCPEAISQLVLAEAPASWKGPYPAQALDQIPASIVHATELDLYFEAKSTERVRDLFYALRDKSDRTIDEDGSPIHEEMRRYSRSKDCDLFVCIPNGDDDSRLREGYGGKYVGWGGLAPGSGWDHGFGSGGLVSLFGSAMFELEKGHAFRPDAKLVAADGSRPGLIILSPRRSRYLLPSFSDPASDATLKWELAKTVATLNHEASHHRDRYLVHEWLAANIRLKKLGLPTDALFEKVHEIRTEGGRSYVSVKPSFMHGFSELRAFYVDALSFAAATKDKTLLDDYFAKYFVHYVDNGLKLSFDYRLALEGAELGPDSEPQAFLEKAREWTLTMKATIQRAREAGK